MVWPRAASTHTHVHRLGWMSKPVLCHDHRRSTRRCSTDQRRRGALRVLLSGADLKSPSCCAQMPRWCPLRRTGTTDSLSLPHSRKSPARCRVRRRHRPGGAMKDGDILCLKKVRSPQRALWHLANGRETINLRFALASVTVRPISGLWIDTLRFVGRSAEMARKEAENSLSGIRLSGLMIKGADQRRHRPE
jgi:hypothetical protein